MTLRETTACVPTLEQAHAAAEVLRGDGAAAVLLFGSVADGTAREGSDIDLVAVFDDIDYAERYPRRWRLEAKCAAAAGVPVDVHVTDWPEWTHRTNEVSSSFEWSIARHRRTRTLSEREPDQSAVRWGKEIGMPDNNLNEALERLNGVHQALGQMTAACRPWDGEATATDGRGGIGGRQRRARLRGLCADAAMTIENALKAWAALSGVPAERTHSIAKLVSQARPLSDGLGGALAPLRDNTMRPSQEDWDDVSCWRVGGTYPDALPQATPDLVEPLARLLTRSAVAVADETVTRLLDEGAELSDERLSACRAQIRAARAVLAAGDVANGISPDSWPSDSARPDAAARRGLRRWLSERRAARR